MWSAWCGPLGAGLVSIAALAASPVAAQTPPLANWQYSVGEVLVPLGGPVPEWRIILGGGALIEPIYEGSQRYSALPSVVFDVRYKDIAFLSDGEGVGVNLLRGPTYRAGLAITYDLGRNHHVQTRLAGLGNIDPAPEAKLFAEYFLPPFVFTFDVRKAIGGYDGIIGDLGLYVPVPAAKDFYVFTGPTVTFADSDYMQAYFGISPLQAERSQFHVFTARGGLERAGWGVTALYKYSDHWWLEGEAAWEYLLGDAANSPIVEDKSQFTAGVNLLYRF